MARNGSLAQAIRDPTADEPTGRQPEIVAAHAMRAGSPSISPGDSLARASRIMDSCGTRELPVVEARALVGILTRTDIAPYLGHFEWTTVHTAMTADPVTVSPETPIGQVLSLLLDRGFNSLPVTAGGEVLGMISRSDVLRALAPNA